MSIVVASAVVAADVAYGTVYGQSAEYNALPGVAISRELAAACDKEKEARPGQKWPGDISAGTARHN